MKKIFILMLILLSICGCSIKQESYSYYLNLEIPMILNENLVVTMIAEGVHVVDHSFPWRANSMIVEMKTGEVVLIDTPYTNDATQLVVEWIKSKMGENIEITVINTGFHFDNLGGNNYLEQEGFEIIGSSLTVQMIKERGESSRQQILKWLAEPKDKAYYNEYKVLEYVNPNEIITMEPNETYELEFGDEKLVLYYPDESHSPDNMIVYIPSKKILYGGCMVKSLESQNLGNIQDANIGSWRSSIDMVVSEFSAEEVIMVVPGHGDVGDYALLEWTKELLSQD